MMSDLYTKSMLTLIAAALICLCVQSAVSLRVVSAQTVQIPQKVILDGISTNMPRLEVHIGSVGGDPIGALPVRAMTPLPVRIVK